MTKYERDNVIKFSSTVIEQMNFIFLKCQIGQTRLTFVYSLLSHQLLWKTSAILCWLEWYLGFFEAKEKNPPFCWIYLPLKAFNIWNGWSRRLLMLTWIIDSFPDLSRQGHQQHRRVKQLRQDRQLVQAGQEEVPRPSQMGQAIQMSRCVMPRNS